MSAADDTTGSAEGALQAVASTPVRRDATPEAPHPSGGKEYGLGVLKGVISAIPYAGGLINELLFDARSRLKQDRLNAFFFEVAADVRKLGEEKLDKPYLTSERFSDLIEDICNRVAREGSETKRRHFRKVLLDAMQGKAPPTFEGVFIHILGEMTEAELDVLGGFVWAHSRQKELNLAGRKSEVAAIDYSQPAIKGYLATDYKLIVQSLIRKGLMFDDSFGRFDTPPHTVVAATELGAAFHRWLTA